MEPSEHSLEVEDRLKDYELQRIHRAKSKVSLPYCGACYYCSEPVPPPKPWCDASCRDDFEREQLLLARAGK